MVASHQRSASREVCHHNRGVAGMGTMRHGNLPVANAATCVFFEMAITFICVVGNPSIDQAKLLGSFSPWQLGHGATRDGMEPSNSPETSRYQGLIGETAAFDDEDQPRWHPEDLLCENGQTMQRSRWLPGCHHDRIIMVKSQEE